MGVGTAFGFLCCLDREPLSGRVKFYFPGIGHTFMMAMAETSQKKVVEELNREGKLLSNSDPRARATSRIAKRLIQAAHRTPEFRKSIERLGLKFKLYVVESRKVNA